MSQVLAFLLLLAACLCQLAVGFRVGGMMSMDSKLTRQQFFKKSVATTTGAVFAATQLKEPALAAAVKAPSLEGGAAPTFKLPSNTGKDISLEDLTSTGKYTVLYFYPGDFTQGCTIEANAFERDFDEFAKLNAQIVGVSVDSVDKHLDFKKKYGLRFPLLSDQGAVVSESYGSSLSIPLLGKFSNRQTYIISPEGKVVKVYTDVESKVAKHSQEVLADLKKIAA